MKYDLSKPKPTRPIFSIPRFFVFLVIMLVIILTELLYRNSLFDSSVDLIRKFHADKDSDDFIFSLCKFVSKLPEPYVLLFVGLLIYSFCNTYKTVIFIMSMLISTYLISLMKLIYKSPRPYWNDLDILALSCEGGYGNPSGHTFLATVMGMVTWEITINNNPRLKERRLLKGISLVLYLLVMLAVAISRILLGVHSINQVIYGYLLGFSLYAFFFHVFYIDLLRADQLKYIITNLNTPLVSSVVIMSLFGIGLLFYFLDLNSDRDEEWTSTLVAICKDHIKEYKMLKYEGMSGIITGLSSIGVFLGIYLEYVLLFHKNDSLWEWYNFENTEEEDEEALVTNYRINLSKEGQWNMTSFFPTLLRIIITVFSTLLFLLLYLLISNEADLIVVWVFKVWLSLFLCMMNLFLFNKVLCKVLKISNLTVFHLTADSF